jgi:hypothetical protein
MDAEQGRQEAAVDYTAISLWVLGAALEICIAVVLYWLAQRRYGWGWAWAVAGLLFNVLAVLAYVVYAMLRPPAARPAVAGPDYRLVHSMLGHQQGYRLLERQWPVPSHFERMKDLIARRQWSEARAHARDRMLAAHQAGDANLEEFYRETLQRLDKIPGAGPDDD